MTKNKHKEPEGINPDEIKKVYKAFVKEARKMEKEIIEVAMDTAQQNKSEAARLLDIPRTTLCGKLASIKTQGRIIHVARR